MPKDRRIDVALEVGPKRTFAVALEWPGWSRSGRNEDEALEALLAYAPRYVRVVVRSRVSFQAPSTVSDLRVVERLQGGATTDFGAPGEPPRADHQPLSEPELDRQLRLLNAAWRAFDNAAQDASGVTLRTGPRGGGRDVAKMTMHVLGAEEGYLTQLGSRPPRGEMRPLRKAVLAALEARAAGQDPPEPNRVKKRWSPRYHIRRSAWHALDHAWEIEDRAG